MTVRKLSVILIALCLTVVASVATAAGSHETTAAAPAASTAQTIDSAWIPTGQPATYFNVDGKTPDQIKGKITYWSWDPNFFGMVKKMNMIYPNVTFDFVSVKDSTDYMLKLQTGLASGGVVPDVLAMEMAAVGRFYDMGITEDIGSAPWNIDKKLLIPYLASIGTDNQGKFIGVPNTVGAGAVYYRRDIAKKYLGTDDPQKIGEMLSTWEGFIKTGEQLKQASGGKVSMVSGLDALVTPLIQQNGKPWRDGNKLLITQNYLDTFKFLARVKDARIDAGLDMWSPAYFASFAQDNVFCHVGSIWFESFIIKPNDPNGAGKWGVTNNPGKPYNWGGIWWGMYKGSKAKDAVAAYLRYEMSPIGAQNKYEMIHFYPGLQQAYTSDYITKPNEFFGGENVAPYYLDTMKKMTVPRPLENDDTFANTFATYAQELSHVGGDPAQLVAKVQSDMLAKFPDYQK